MGLGKRNPLGKPTGLDYAVMFGGPIVFLAIAWWGITALLGPPPPANPVTRLKQGVVKAGMSVDDVIAQVGEPKSIEPRADGGFSYRYRRGTEEPWVEEDAYVDFTRSGYVGGLHFERTAVRPPE